MTPLTALVRLLDRALRELGDAGETERACRLAAEAFATLERSDPELAERFTGTLHHLTCAPPRSLQHAIGTGPAEARA
jgi:hypothetical protein